jgi:hypothetical protein
MTRLRQSDLEKVDRWQRTDVLEDVPGRQIFAEESDRLVERRQIFLT